MNVAELLRGVLDAQGWSQREAARRCGLSPSGFTFLLGPLKSWPSPETMRGLAVGLQVPLPRVVGAICRSLDLPSSLTSRPAGDFGGQMRAVVESSAGMTPDERMWFLGMVEVQERIFTQRRSGDDDGGA